ncbi:MAG: hypothetical protein FWB91_00265 [Defluviitaleaceae bacterium]|nr:hypothetical protein [Defluviitaleaceae bacterium]
MKNKIPDLKNYLYAQLERLDDESITGDELTAVIERGRAIADISAQIIASESFQLKVIKTAHEMGHTVKAPALLGLVDGGS